MYEMHKLVVCMPPESLFYRDYNEEIEIRSEQTGSKVTIWLQKKVATNVIRIGTHIHQIDRILLVVPAASYYVLKYMGCVRVSHLPEPSVKYMISLLTSRW